MNLKPLSPILLGLTAISLAMAPDPMQTFEFIPSECDFGTIREEDGSVSATVKAVNVSADTTFITSIRTSCGCTGAAFTDRIIAPGDTAEVTVSYNPEGRPGRFLKTIKVFSGVDRESSIFKIKGNVLPGDETLRRSYPHQTGNLRFSSAAIDMGELNPGEVRPVFIGLYNVGVNPLALYADSDSPAFEPRIVPDTIQPNDPATLSVVVKAKRISVYGKEFQHNVYLLDTQSKDTIASIPIGGILKKVE